MKRFKLKQTWPLHLLLLPGMALVFLFYYGPMVGITLAFQDYNPTKGFFGSDWVGLTNFRYVFALPETVPAVRNTLIIAGLKIIFGMAVPVVFSLLLNEIRHMLIKRAAQTMIYFPHFLSWVILGGIVSDVLALKGGAVNQILGWFGLDPIFFLGSNTWFRVVIVVSDVWKEFGFATIIYLAALTGINPALYEAAAIDGANRWKQLWNVTVPGMLPIIALVGVLSLGNILNANFDQIFNLYNILVYGTGDIIDTYVYRVGLLNAQYGLATAVGLVKSAVGFILITVSYWLAYRYANYRIF